MSLCDKVLNSLPSEASIGFEYSACAYLKNKKYLSALNFYMLFHAKQLPTSLTPMAHCLLTNALQLVCQTYIESIQGSKATRPNLEQMLFANAIGIKYPEFWPRMTRFLIFGYNHDDLQDKQVSSLFFSALIHLSYFSLLDKLPKIDVHDPSTWQACKEQFTHLHTTFFGNLFNKDVSENSSCGPFARYHPNQVLSSLPDSVLLLVQNLSIFFKSQSFPIKISSSSSPKYQSRTHTISSLARNGFINIDRTCETHRPIYFAFTFFKDRIHILGSIFNKLNGIVHKKLCKNDLAQCGLVKLSSKSNEPLFSPGWDDWGQLSKDISQQTTPQFGYSEPIVSDISPESSCSHNCSDSDNNNEEYQATVSSPWTFDSLDISENIQSPKENFSILDSSDDPQQSQSFSPSTIESSPEPDISMEFIIHEELHQKSTHSVLPCTNPSQNPSFQQLDSTNNSQSQFPPSNVSHDQQISQSDSTNHRSTTRQMKFRSSISKLSNSMRNNNKCTIHTSCWKKRQSNQSPMQKNSIAKLGHSLRNLKQYCQCNSSPKQHKPCHRNYKSNL